VRYLPPPDLRGIIADPEHLFNGRRKGQTQVCRSDKRKAATDGAIEMQCPPPVWARTERYRPTPRASGSGT